MDDLIQSETIKNLIKVSLSPIKDILSYNIKITMEDHIINFSFLETDYAHFLKTTSLKQIKETLDLLDQYYYAGNSIISDKTYDIISDYYYEKTGGDKSSKVGYSIPNIVKTKLPITCTSLDKVKPGQSKLTSFLKKYTDSKIISSKLDGNSLLVGREAGIPKAYTRGDGVYGQDVSHILCYIKGTNGNSLYNIIKNLKCDYFYIRGEIIISIDNWENNSHLGSNARNVVAGFLHRKELNSKDQYYLSNIVDFLGYEYIVGVQNKIKPKYTIEQQFNKIIKYNIKTPLFHIYKNSEVTEDTLPDILAKFRNDSDYEIDGIVMENNVYNSRYKSGNPKYAKAFKMEMYNDTGVAKVLDIDWSITKSGKLKPTLVIEPTIINQVKISRVYAYNAKNVLDLEIGVGSTLEIIRSGDVIPKVKTVIDSKFNESDDFPDKNYIWDQNNVDIIVVPGDSDDESISEIAHKQIEYFIKTVGIEFIKIGTITKLYEVGFDSIYSYISLKNKDKLLKADGIKSISADKMFKSIQTSLQNVEPYIFAAAIPAFGNMGRKRMKLIFENIPDFNIKSESELRPLIEALDGFSSKTADKIINGISEYNEYKKYYEKMYGTFGDSAEIDIQSNKLDGYVFCFSGVRSKETEDLILSNGGEISNSFTKKTTHLIVKDISKSTSKTKKALSQNKTVMELSEFEDLLI